MVPCNSDCLYGEIISRGQIIVNKTSGAVMTLNLQNMVDETEWNDSFIMYIRQLQGLGKHFFHKNSILYLAWAMSRSADSVVIEKQLDCPIAHTQGYRCR